MKEPRTSKTEVLATCSTRPRDEPMVLKGYIDESYSRENPPKVFGLTCTIADARDWLWIEWAWENCLDEKNAALRRAGRREITRYHAAEINSYAGDFEGWDDKERREFHEKLIRKVFARHLMGYEGYAINLEQLVELWPEAKRDPLEFAYGSLTKFLMIEIGKGMSGDIPDWKITLFHDRCPYDGSFLSAFDQLINDPSFKYRHCFTTIEPKGWKQCTALQPADLIAYENMKEIYTGFEVKKRGRRKIFASLLSLESFRPHLKSMNDANILLMKRIYQNARRKKSGKQKRGG